MSATEILVPTEEPAAPRIPAFARKTVLGVATAFVTILLAVYYYDIRTRVEGLDLETDLQRLTAAS